MNKMILIAPAIAAGLLIAGCGPEPQTAADVPPPPSNGGVDAAGPASAEATRSATTPFEMAADAPVTGHCALDSANGQRGEVVTLPAGGTVTFGGWAADAARQVPVDALLVFGNGAASHAVPLVAGAHRPDVAAALHSDALAHAGFNLQVDVSGIPAGTVLTIEFTLGGLQFVGLNGGPDFSFTPAISFFVACETDAEVDALAGALEAALVEGADRHVVARRPGAEGGHGPVLARIRTEPGPQQIGDGEEGVHFVEATASQRPAGQPAQLRPYVARQVLAQRP